MRRGSKKRFVPYAMRARLPKSTALASPSSSRTAAWPSRKARKPSGVRSAASRTGTPVTPTLVMPKPSGMIQIQ